MPKAMFQMMRDGSVRHDIKCVNCPLSTDPELNTNCMWGSGRKGATYFFVGASPGFEDDAIGEPYTGKTGRELRGLLERAGIRIEDCYFTNCLKCFSRSEPSKSNWKKCRAHLLQELQEVDPTVIVSVGAKATTWLTGQTGVNRLRKTILPFSEGPKFAVYPLRQPAMLFHAQYEDEKESIRDSLVEDLRHLSWMVQTGKVVRPKDVETDYKIAMTPEHVEEFFDEMEYYSEVAFDFETSSLFPTKQDYLAAVGFSFGEGVGRAIPVRSRGLSSVWWWDDDFEVYLKRKLADFFRKKVVWGHNAIQFDQKWSRVKLGVHSLRFCFDTMLAHYILDEQQGTHGLEQLATRFTTMKPWKSTFTLEDTLQMCEYLNKDVDATYRLRRVFEPQLDERQQWLLYELLMPLANELFEAELAGVKLNEAGLENLSSYIKGRIAESYQELKLDPAVRAFEISRNRSFNVESHDDVRVLMRDLLQLPCIKETKGGQYSTAADVLDEYKYVPSISKVMKIRGLSKIKGTYVEGFREKVLNGRIHTTYKVHGTVTGRPSSADPNLMNLPRGDTAGKVLEDANAVKEVFSADDGQVLLQGDYSQAELRCLASVSGDESLIDIYLRGEDVHSATAAKVHGIEIGEVTKAQRSQAKQINFGIVYGQSEKGLQEAFVRQGSTEEEASRFYSLHRQMFPGVWRWLEMQEQIVRRDRKQVTYFGRTRRYQEIDRRTIRMAMNFPIQSLASDITEVAIVRCGRALRKLGLPARMVLTVYDSIVFSISPDRFWECAELIHRIMSGINFPWMKVPMEVDLEVGYTWGNLKEVDISSRKILTENK